MVLAIMGAGLLVFGVLMVLPYIGSLNGVAYGYFPVTLLGGLGFAIILMGLISGILAIAVRNTDRPYADDEPDIPTSAGPLANFLPGLEAGRQ